MNDIFSPKEQSERADEIKLYKRDFILFPNFWDDEKNQLEIDLRWREFHFSKADISEIPDEKGIYCFVVSPKVKYFDWLNYLFYIGKTNRTLRERYKEYLKEAQGKGKYRPKLFDMFKRFSGNLFFYCSAIEDEKLVSDTEEKLINTFLPPVNTDYPIAKTNKHLINIYEH
jgi:excinuclease UvrABC nuclease subunit